MAYIAGLIIVALFFLSLHYFTELKKVQKITIGVVLFAIISSATLFNSYNSHKREQMLNATLKFKQGKTIFCDSKEVNATDFTLSIGTYTFIGKKDSPHYAEMISVSSCR